ncbi:MAG: hypothetical protein ACREQE_11545 [Candidatus Binataceae bacterium]
MLFVLVLGGCVPLGTVGGIGQSTATGLSAQVPIYDPPSLSGKNYIKVAQLGAWSCSSIPFSPAPGKEDVINELRLKAQSMGADGLTNVACGHQSPSGIRCASPTSCTATAIRLDRGTP